MTRREWGAWLSGLILWVPSRASMSGQEWARPRPSTGTKTWIVLGNHYQFSEAEWREARQYLPQDVLISDWHTPIGAHIFDRVELFKPHGQHWRWFAGLVDESRWVVGSQPWQEATDWNTFVRCCVWPRLAPWPSGVVVHKN